MEVDLVEEVSIKVGGSIITYMEVSGSFHGLSW